MNSNLDKQFQNVWMITREYGNLAGAGGVKDVVKQLAGALAKSGRNVTIVLPCYGFIQPRKLGFVPADLEFEVDLPYVKKERREFVKIWQSEGFPKIYLIDSRRFREKMNVYTYTAEEEAKNPDHRYGTGHFDYFAVNVLLQKTALSLMIRLNQRPDIIHCHDGHTAILPALIREREGFRHYFHKTGCVVTIHNAGQGYHQEVGDLDFAQTITGLPRRIITENTLEGSFDPLLAASHYAAMNTVSENYARELRETYADEATGWLGHRLMARGISLTGITNGIAPEDFNLQKPQELGIAASFSPASPSKKGHPGKMTCKQKLIAAINEGTMKGLQQDGILNDTPNLPLFTFIGRLTAQKGVDIMIGAIKNLLHVDHNFQIVILGTGEKWLEDQLVSLAAEQDYQGRVCVLRTYDTLLANKIYAAGDFFLVPSKYEPCGLTDFMAQVFGNIPIVHHIGGLVKIIDGETGFAYKEHTPDALLSTMQRALSIFRENRKQINAMQKAAVDLIQSRYTWDKVMLKYLELYQLTARLGERSERRL